MRRFKSLVLASVIAIGSVAALANAQCPKRLVFRTPLGDYTCTLTSTNKDGTCNYDCS